MCGVPSPPRVSCFPGLAARRFYSRRCPSRRAEPRKTRRAFRNDHLVDTRNGLARRCRQRRACTRRTVSPLACNHRAAEMVARRIVRLPSPHRRRLSRFHKSHWRRASRLRSGAGAEPHLRLAVELGAVALPTGAEPPTPLPLAARPACVPPRPALCLPLSYRRDLLFSLTFPSLFLRGKLLCAPPPTAVAPELPPRSALFAHVPIVVSPRQVARGSAANCCCP